MALFENCGQPVLHVVNTSSYTPLPLHPAGDFGAKAPRKPMIISE